MEEEFTYKKPKIREIELDGDRIFISKSNLFGYKVVFPLRKDITIPFYDKELKKFNWNNINWKNLITGGSWKNLIFIIILVLLFLGAINEYTQAIKLANDCLLKDEIVPNVTKIFYNFTG